MADRLVKKDSKTYVSKNKKRHKAALRYSLKFFIGRRASFFSS